jgi:HEAT repeat protein
MRVLTTIAIALSAMASQGGMTRGEGVAIHAGEYETDPVDGLVMAEGNFFRADPADSLYRVAREALNRGEWKRASELFVDVQKKYPQSQYVPDAMYYQAFALSRTGNERDLRTALRVIEDQQRRFPRASTGNDAGALATRIRGSLAQLGDREATSALLDAARRGRSDSDAAGREPPPLGERDPMPSSARRSGAACADEDDDSDMRIAALNALLQMDSERAIPILKQVLARRDECSYPLRRKAVFLVAQKQSDESADILLGAARNDPDIEVRRQAVFWLSEVHSDRALAALDSILHGAKDNELREKAIFALSNTNTTRGVQVLREFALSDAPEELRAKAVFWLGQSSRRSADNTAFLKSVFDKTDSEEIQNAVIQAMSEAPGDEGTRWMLSVVENPKQPVEVRKKALFWAGQRHSLDVATLIPLYDRLDDDELKEHFIFVLSERRESAATDKLIAIARSDKNTEMRKKALFWLAQKNDPRAKQLLMEIINQ